jgi:hypothetical protein
VFRTLIIIVIKVAIMFRIHRHGKNSHMWDCGHGPSQPTPSSVNATNSQGGKKESLTIRCTRSSRIEIRKWKLWIYCVDHEFILMALPRGAERFVIFYITHQHFLANRPETFRKKVKWQLAKQLVRHKEQPLQEELVLWPLKKSSLHTSA